LANSTYAGKARHQRHRRSATRHLSRTRQRLSRGPRPARFHRGHRGER
jgi:hypothetical protein